MSIKYYHQGVWHSVGGGSAPTIWARIVDDLQDFLTCPGDGSELEISYNRWGYTNTSDGEVFTAITGSLSGIGTVLQRVSCSKQGTYAITYGVGWNTSGSLSDDFANYIGDGYGLNAYRYGYRPYDSGLHTMSLFLDYPGLDSGFPSLPTFVTRVAQESGSDIEIDECVLEISYLGAIKGPNPYA